MSMISAQIDELRELVGDGSIEWVAGPVRASVLREAADTIWQLRDDLQRANAAVRNAEHDESMAWDRVRKAESENAKLRELVALMYRDMQGVLDMSTDTVWVDDIGTLRDEMDCHMQAMAELGMPPADYERRMRELGIEVD